ncbi:MAG: tetratricopeptide repeat protein [Candidatus Hydrogenedentes bacterium]|nr:tetratricopeptide repeat protein [Candidatus Hydrogenedentota bacterium]
MENETPSGKPGAHNIIFAATLFLLTILVFQGVRHNAFINFDDPRLITQTPQVRAGLTWSGVQWAFTTGYFAIWHPLTWLSHMADVSLFGMNPAGHHLMAVFIHALGMSLLFVALARMTGSPWRSAIAAALIAVHPLRVESVAWAAERKDVLYAAFWFATILAYAHYAKKPAWTRYAMVFLAAACALMAKPMAVTLPCALLLLDYWPLARLRRVDLTEGVSRPTAARLVMEKIPLFLLSFICSIITFRVSHGQGASKTLVQYPLWLRVENVIVSYVAYLGKMVWPFDLSVHYPFPSEGYATVTVVACAAALLVITALSLYLARTRPYVLVGWLWYLGTLIPVIGLVQVGHRAMADRFTYVPSVGIAVAIVWLLADFVRDKAGARKVLTVCVLLLIAAFSVLSIRQIAMWRDSRTLFAHAVRIVPESGVAHNNLGLALMESGDLAGAQAQFEQAAEFSREGASALINLGIVKGMQGDINGAAAELKRAVAMSPGDPDAHFNLAVALQALGDRAGAAEHFKEALRLRPSYAEARAGLDALGTP